MTYLITGGCGFIGVNFAEKLLELHHDVILIDNLSRKGADLNLEYISHKFSERCEFHNIDIGDDSEVNRQKLLDLAEKSDVIYHLAGQVAVTTSILDPRVDFANNALGTLNVLEAVRNSQKKPILIYASTNKV